MLDKILEHLKNLGFEAFDFNGDDSSISFIPKKYTVKQCYELSRELKRKFGKKNIIVDVFIFTKKIIIDVKVKAVHDENELRKVK